MIISYRKRFIAILDEDQLRVKRLHSENKAIFSQKPVLTL